MKEKKVFLSSVILALIFLFSAPIAKLYTQPTEICKINFCNCCGDSVLYYIYDKSNILVGTFWTWSDGCTHGSVGVNLTPWAMYKVVPQNCVDGALATHFTACVCPPYEEWADTVRILCCAGDDGDVDKHGHNIDLEPGEFSLSQNFPNPFNPVTLIKFAVPVESFVSLIIYDAAGKEVSSLADGVYPAGVHQVSWDASSFASGIYFYKLKAGSYAAERKMALIK